MRFRKRYIVLVLPVFLFALCRSELEGELRTTIEPHLDVCARVAETRKGLAEIAARAAAPDPHSAACAASCPSPGGRC